MAFVIADRVKETTTTTGTGTVTLLGASAGFQSFAAIGNANTTYYTIAAQTGTEWEVGIGTFTSSGTTLARTTVLSNSSGTEPSALNFSAGTKDVFVTYPSDRALYGDITGSLTTVDNALVRFDSTAGNIIQTSLVTVADDGAITAPQVGSMIPFYYANQAAFPSASTSHGAVAHSHADGAMFFAHGGSWVRILDTGGPLGTPSSGTATNLTGTASGLTAGNGTTNANLTGDVTSNGNATSIAAGVIVDADINASAGIVDTKLATISTALKVSNSATTATNANTASAIVARDASGNFSAGTITASLTGNASTVTTNANLTGDVTSVGNATSIAAGVIVDADINASAAIVDTKLATISTASKVSNSATTATSANTASAIVARDASGNFTAGTITAALTGNASGSAATFTSTSQNSQFNSVGVGTAASTTAGEIRATNNITAYYSDDRFKTNLGNIPDALAKVLTLNGFYYEANELAQSFGYEKILEVGVSAQQVQAVQPEVVVPAPIDENYLTVRYERLVPLLIEAIKELNAKVTALEQVVAK